jgi:hypothetical protein
MEATAIRALAVVAAVNRNEKEAAIRLGVSVHSLRRWRVYGGGPRFLKMGSRISYPDSELEAFEASCLRRSTSDQGPAPKVPQKVGTSAKVRNINGNRGECSTGLLSPEKGKGGES